MSKPIINTFIESYTPPLPLFKVQGKPHVTLELKPYIQPFERVLAKAELAGLLGPQSFLGHGGKTICDTLFR